MRYLIYTPVDAVTGVPVTDAPAANGPADPAVEGLTFVFALESQYPTNTPTFYGTSPNASKVDVPGVLEEVTKAEFEAAQAAEMVDRDKSLRAQLMERIPAERWNREVSGLIWKGVFIDTDEKSQPKIQSARSAAQDGLRVDGSGWKCGDPQTGEIIYRATSNAEMIEIGSMAFNYVQACYDREGVLMTAVKDGTYTDDMLNTGWPARV